MLMYEILNEPKRPIPETSQWFLYDSAKFFHKTLENSFSFSRLFYRFGLHNEHVSGGVSSWLNFQSVLPIRILKNSRFEPKKIPKVISITITFSKNLNF